jgi:hypothetical protein
MGIHSSVVCVLNVSKGLNGQKGRITMETLYVGIAFSTMVVLPLLVAKWSGTRNEDFRDFTRKVE